MSEMEKDKHYTGTYERVKISPHVRNIRLFLPYITYSNINHLSDNK